METTTLRTDHIPVIITNGLNNKAFMQQLTNKFPRTKFKDTLPEIINTFKRKKEQYINNFIETRGFIPQPQYLPTKYLKEQAIKTSAYYQLFNYQRVALVIDYPATITKSDNGFQSIKKPKLDKITYGLVNSTISGFTPATLTLIDYSTLSRVTINKGDTIDDILVELTTQIIQDPIGYNTLVDPEEFQKTELYELSQLYDIDIQTKNLITYSTYITETGNTYTNMYPREYPTDITVQQLQETINLYTDYGIINQETTKKLKRDKERQRRLINNLNSDLRCKAHNASDKLKVLTKPIPPQAEAPSFNQELYNHKVSIAIGYKQFLSKTAIKHTTRSPKYTPVFKDQLI